VSRSDRAAEIRRLLATEGPSVKANTTGFNTGRREQTGALDDYDALTEEARAVKEDAIERLPELLDELEATVESNGGTVHRAADAAEATRVVREVAADADADRAVKSKSTTTEEVELNEALAGDGVDVVETDLGEWVLQLADETPSHVVAPAIHRSRESIAELFAATFGPDDPPESAAELTRFARERLLEAVTSADRGDGRELPHRRLGHRRAGDERGQRPQDGARPRHARRRRGRREGGADGGGPRAVRGAARQVRNRAGRHLLPLAPDAAGRLADARLRRAGRAARRRRGA
jgi:hypothetical protein